MYTDNAEFHSLCNGEEIWAYYNDKVFSVGMKANSAPLTKAEEAKRQEKAKEDIIKNQINEYVYILRNHIAKTYGIDYMEAEKIIRDAKIDNPHFIAELIYKNYFMDNSETVISSNNKITISADEFFGYGAE